MNKFRLWTRNWWILHAMMVALFFWLGYAVNF